MEYVENIGVSKMKQHFILSTTPDGKADSCYEFKNGVSIFDSEKERDEFTKWMRFVHDAKRDSFVEAKANGVDALGVDIWNHTTLKNLRKYRFELKEYFEKLCSYDEPTD